MNTIQSQLTDVVRKVYAKVLSNDRTDLVSILNRNGFPVSNSSDDNDLINKSLQAIQVSNDFRHDLASTMEKYAAHFQPFKSNKMNFAAQDISGDYTITLTGKDLTTDISPYSVQSSIFQKNSYVPAFLPFAGAKKNEDGGGDSVGDWAKLGLGLLSDKLQRDSAENQANTALAIENAKIKALQAQAAAEAAKGNATTSVIKAYAPLFIIGGIAVVAGISAYFYFKKKKA